MWKAVFRLAAEKAARDVAERSRFGRYLFLLPFAPFIACAFVAILVIAFVGAAVSAQSGAACNSMLPFAAVPIGSKGLTVKGAPVTQVQVQNASILLGVAKQLNAPVPAMLGMIYAAMGESSLGADSSTYAGPYAYGVLQTLPGTYNGGHDTAGEARGFLTGGTSFGSPGGIKAAQRGDPAWMIANETEVNLVWLTSHGDSYGHQWPGGQAQGMAEAAAFVKAAGINGGQALFVSGQTGGCAQSVSGQTGQVQDPIPGFSPSRDDMGVDACATPGKPIFAPANSVLVDVLQNWYAGQPLLLFKFVPPLTGTFHGDQYWFLAEQISPVTEKLGTQFRAGQTVATYASSGTCIEIGWGSPSTNSRTFVPTDASPPPGALTPEGESFKIYFHIPWVGRSP